MSINNHYNTKLTNRRLIPYSIPDDKIQAKVEFLKNNTISYKKDLDVVLYLNAYGWNIVSSGVTNEYGIYDFKVNTSYLEASPVYFCSGYAQVTYNGADYPSNAVRFNFYDNTPFPSSASSASSSSASSVSASSKSSESSSKSSTSSKSSASKSSSSSVSQQTSSSVSSKSSWSTYSSASSASSRSSRSSASSASSKSSESSSYSSASSKSSASSASSKSSASTASSKSSESSSKSSESSSKSSASSLSTASSKSSESSSKSSESSSESSSKSSESSSKSSQSSESSASSLSSASSESSSNSSESSLSSASSVSSESSQSSYSSESTIYSAVTRIGDVVVTNNTNYTSDYERYYPVTVPPNCELMLMTVMTQCSGDLDPYASGIDLVVAGEHSYGVNILNYEDGSGSYVSSWRLTNPIVGSNQIIIYLYAPPNEELTLFLSYYKGVDTSSPIGASGYAYISDNSSTNITMGSLSASDGDAIVGLAYIHPSGWNTSWTNATEVSKITSTSHIGAYGEKLNLTTATKTELDISGSSGARIVVLAGFVINAIKLSSDSSDSSSKSSTSSESSESSSKSSSSSE